MPSSKAFGLAAFCRSRPRTVKCAVVVIALLALTGSYVQIGFPVLSRSGNTTGYMNFTGSFINGNCTQTDANHNLVDAGAACGTGSGGGGIVTYSGPALTFITGTQFFPIGGGGVSSTTETNVDVESPAAVTVTNFYVQLSAAVGAGNSVAFTWRKNAADTAITCTISGASATTCNDTTHTATLAQADLIDIKAVGTGTIVASVTTVMATQFGTILSGQVNAGTAHQTALYSSAGSTISGGGPGTSGQVWTSNGAGSDPTFQNSLSVSGFYLTSGTTKYCGGTFQVCTPASGLTILNTPGSSSIISSGGTQVLQSAAVSGFNGVLAGIAIAGGNTSLTVALTCSPTPSSGTAVPLCGVGFARPASNQLLTIYQTFNNSGAGNLAAYQIVAWTSQTNPAVSRSGSGMNPGPNASVWWAKLTCNVAGCASGNITIQTSPDGVNYSQGFTEAVGVDFTGNPTAWGVIGSPGSTTDDLYVDILSFLVQ